MAFPTELDALAKGILGAVKLGLLKVDHAKTMRSHGKIRVVGVKHRPSAGEGVTEECFSVAQFTLQLKDAGQIVHGL